MQSKEEYIGGFYSPLMKRSMVGGYGIYATNQRIIGLEIEEFASLNDAPNGIFLGSAPEVTLMTHRSLSILQERKLTKDEGDKIIAWLDQGKKDFELSKGQVSQIEIKNLGLMRDGYFRVTSTSGEEVKVWIYHEMYVEITKNLMQAFLPEAVKLID
jgi:hypothetical protein